MSRYGQLVVGPAGSGKSTYCSNVVKHFASLRRTVYVINLDPAAESFDYPVRADVRELIQVDDVMEDKDLRLGPNGGLVFCMEYLVENIEWLEGQLGEGTEDYFLFDCPGQIELYTHIPAMRELVDKLKLWNFSLCSVFLLDSQFLTDAAKFVSGVMIALSTMITLELPHINIISKMDLLDKRTKETIEKYLSPDTSILLHELKQVTDKKYHKLNKALCGLIHDYSLVQFQPLDVTEEGSMDDILLFINHIIQYGEGLDVRVPTLAEEMQDDEMGPPNGGEMDDS